VTVPTALLIATHDMVPPPREIAERMYNVARWTQTDVGGHFLEWEEPQLVAEDMRAFFGSLPAR
jgi:pimeloyl-ACP methyl ester carboxylesterase